MQTKEQITNQFKHACAVSRIIGRSDLYEMQLTLDINIDVFPVDVGQKIQLCLASTLNSDGTPDTRQYDPVSCVVDA